ncbi:hypothetical protein VF04_20030 [Nostoc linckia z7]|uniref:Uncharacterized protein n=2 Tax=Nostoc linckia TaxID=92942 RepID=A0A9Q5Z955_NOSLI|nr:hypothetical protein VF02_16645 [Nostoc linckia z1]PHJ66610.1 hypothetical protein VF05_18920 [Nostoc linckia z3]PHJ72731.1 hypothetical protein VF03_18020 [Nostoc linckia z2]PHJ80910.1 hypothetical protein VF06_21210 [Nostoc linckia z4]PHJ87262.1 hypothetical protein VF07_21110 [Nostoc linckia z6]PHJ95150.1 hypothetical protein VF04_20030 [Nostoc linckia z7]PHK00664.1 hypothetical protein VF08_23680 [Nostoc linckia z8]PHK38783.1 hypothetical protein VF12_16785 [Nostoc linckia z15]PHK443
MVRQAHQPGKGFLFALYPLPLTLFPTSLRSLMTNGKGQLKVFETCISLTFASEDVKFQRTGLVLFFHTK